VVRVPEIAMGDTPNVSRISFRQRSAQPEFLADLFCYFCRNALLSRHRINGIPFGQLKQQESEGDHGEDDRGSLEQSSCQVTQHVS